jgi:hypothetical protein
VGVAPPPADLAVALMGNVVVSVGVG